MNEREIAKLIMKRIIFWSVLMIIGLFIWTIAFTYAHESVHEQICLHDGGNPKTFINIFETSYVNCDAITSNGRLAHSINEAFGYQLKIVIFTIWLLTYFFGVLQILLTTENAVIRWKVNKNRR